MLKLFERAHHWQALRILAACAIAYGGCKLIGLREVYWALVTAVVVTQPAFGDTLSASRDRVLGTLIGALVGLAVIVAVQRGASSLILFWIAMAPLSIVAAIKPSLRLCCVTLIIVVLVPSTGNPFALPFERVIGILTGTMASLVVSAATLARPKTPSS